MPRPCRRCDAVWDPPLEGFAPQHIRGVGRRREPHPGGPAYLGKGGGRGRRKEGHERAVENTVWMWKHQWRTGTRSDAALSRSRHVASHPPLRPDFTKKGPEHVVEEAGFQSHLAHGKGKWANIEHVVEGPANLASKRLASHRGRTTRQNHPEAFSRIHLHACAKHRLEGRHKAGRMHIGSDLHELQMERNHTRHGMGVVLRQRSTVKSK